MATQATISIDEGATTPRCFERWGLGVLTIGLAGNALAAYKIGPIPIPWLSQCLPILFVVWHVLRTQHLLLVPGLGKISLFLVWAVVVTGVQSVMGDYRHLMPTLATSSYEVFVLLRFVNLVAFIAQMYLTYWLLVHGYRTRVYRTVVGVSVLVALASLYIYVAQVFGLWEPPRTRMGTGGEEQAVVFTYAFHRALGTFREPSHLAEWLMVPLCLSFLSLRLRGLAFSLPIVLVLLFTGSMTGIGGVFIGLCLAMILVHPLRLNMFKTGLAVLGVFGAGYLLFSFFAVAYADGHVDLLQIIGERLEPILAGGMQETNRAACYRYFAEVPIPALGQGLGNANLCLTDYLRVDVVASMLNLYYCVLYSTGYVGLILMGLFLLGPIVEFWRGPRPVKYQRHLMILAGYCSWLVAFAVHAEELTAMFGTIYAIVCFENRFPEEQECP